MNFDRLSEVLSEKHQPQFRFNQIIHDLSKIKTSWTDITTIPHQLLDDFPIFSWTNSRILDSSDGSSKTALTLTDGQVVETVLMPGSNGYSICISSEVGCPMNCAFCATGALGFKRRLTAEEIADQILFWITQGYSIHSVVFMGMGEPFHNQDAVFTAIKWINQYYGVGYRHISISTCGIPEGIMELSKRYPQINLAISLHAATDNLRERLMPINKTYSLNLLTEALSRYLSVTRRQIMFEYLLIQNLNDTQVEADQLLSWLKQFPSSLVHVNLIGYNETGRGFSAPSHNRIIWFEKYLIKNGISTTIRKSYGQDVDGACGQLAGKLG